MKLFKRLDIYVEADKQCMPVPYHMFDRMDNAAQHEYWGYWWALQLTWLWFSLFIVGI